MSVPPPARIPRSARSDTEIIIVNWNSRQHTLDCLAAVESQLHEVDGSAVTVVDNGSTDGSATAIATHHPRAKLFALRENRGFTGGLAAALRGSTARNVIFLNNDAVPEPGWLAALTRAIEGADDDVIAAGGRILDTTGTRIDFIGGMITFDGHAFQEGFRYPVGSRPEPPSGAEILFACGGNMIARRAALMELGGFDEDYFAYLEDVDFGWRSWIAGYRHLFEPAATVRHASSATSDRLGNVERGVLFERNALQTAIKNYGDETFRDVAGAIFLAYLRRLHHYATRHNSNAAELRRPPFAGTTDSRPPSRLGRLRDRLFGRKALARVDDPLTTMQFRALEWIVRNEARIIDKRRTVQGRRKRTDDEIFRRFPLHFVPTYPGDESLLNGPLFRLLRPDVASADRKLGDIIRT
ncbi:MAG TPA: glycosyltransferase family 2 protein [Thermoanaerobaculia bacterium]|nr:glycosyltransferase family 2 protein [Thermoanaerobaculia bacterium]